MTPFETLHQEQLLGKLTHFDRLIFKGHLTSLFPDGAFRSFLSRQGVLLKEFGRYVERATDEIKAHAQELAKESGRPYEYLANASTKASGFSKEERARAIASRDGVREGLVAVFSTLEPCTSFGVRGNRASHRLEVVRQRRKCLHFYFYFLDPEFGFMHVRLQSWFPFEVQVYVNGREWLGRQLDRRGVPYVRHANAFLRIDDMRLTQRLCEDFARRRWPRVLNAFAARVNPWLPRIRALGFGSYYWVADQAEIATDLMFRSRPALQAILPDLFQHAATAFSADDVMRFLGRKLDPRFQGEVTTSCKRRPEGCRVRHSLRCNSLKMYDKATVLRVETTINNPREFKVLRRTEGRRGPSWRWMPMGKGVANLWRYAKIARAANERYLHALAHVPLKGKAVAELDSLCRSADRNGRRGTRFQPFAADACALFTAVLAGEHAIAGFRNRDLARRLHPGAPSGPDEARRRCAKTSRLISKLRAHGLVSKVKGSRLYRVTPRGHRLMGAAVRLRNREFPAEIQAAA
jgi:hypothetical protein